MSRFNSVDLPKQKLPFSKKNKPWRKQNLDAADKHSFYNDERIRKSLKNKIVNYQLYNGVVNINDLSETVNPYQMDASFIPDNIPHHPIVVPKIDLLVGEESKRRFDWKIMITNNNAITEKENSRRDLLHQKLQEFLLAGYPEEQAEQKLKEVEDFFKYDWQDVRERMSTQILQHYYAEQDFESKFLDGFKDALISAEEIYQTDIVLDEPVLTRLNPLKVRTVKSGNSSRIEDASIIILEDHWSPGKIIDYFHEELKPSDIDYLEDYNNVSRGGSFTDDQNNHVLLRDTVESAGIEAMNTMFGMAELNGHMFNSNHTDEAGNIRVFRVYWRSMKKIQKVKFYDEEGEVQHRIEAEEYKVDKSLGEESKTMWVNEWWEGTKIGTDIYLQMKPRPVQFNRLSNPSHCHPGIVGEIYNTNQGKAVSLMDRMKNYQYMYDVIWDRLNKAIATNYGKIFELDLAKVPDNWEIEKWLHFAMVNKIAVVDSFKEGNKGAATGKLAGGMNTVGGRAIDMETGSYIQQHIQLLEFIKMEMAEIAGVSKQREGAIHQSETASGVERSVNQSSHITEYWFHKHEKVKLRVISAFLETAKIALKGKNKKVQYILDDQTIQMLNMEGDVFAEADYGIVCTSSTKAMELEQIMKQNAQAFMQNGGGYGILMDIYFGSSLTDMRRKIEIAEEKQQAQAQEAQQQQSEHVKAELQQQAEQAQIEAQTQELQHQREDATKRYVAELQANTQMGMKAMDSQDSDGVTNPLDQEKFELDREKTKNDQVNKMRALDDSMKMHNDKMVREDKKIAVSKQKPSTTK
jgi:hypothetical protein